MATYTTNLNLKKPDYSDTADIKDINNNMDTLDAKITQIDTLSMGTLIPDNSDLNNYTTIGKYYVANATSAATMSHIPITSAGGSLEVFYAGHLKAQRYTANYKPSLKWERVYNSGWSDWIIQEVAQRTLGSFSTAAELATLLDTELAAMANSEVRFIIVSASASVPPFVNTYFYMGTLHKRGTATTYGHAMLYASGRADVISCSLANGTWSFELLNVDTSIYDMYGTLADNTDIDTLVGPNKVAYLSLLRTYPHQPIAGVATTIFTFGANYNTTAFLGQIAITPGALYVRRKFDNTGSEWDSWQRIQMSGCGWLDDNTNLNSVTTPGTYGISVNRTYANKPTGLTAGVLEVINVISSSSNYVFQKIWSSNGRLFTRWRATDSGATWNGWYRFEGTAV